MTIALGKRRGEDDWKMLFHRKSIIIHELIIVSVHTLYFLNPLRHIHCKSQHGKIHANDRSEDKNRLQTTGELLSRPLVLNTLKWSKREIKLSLLGLMSHPLLQTLSSFVVVLRSLCNIYHFLLHALFSKLKRLGCNDVSLNGER